MPNSLIDKFGVAITIENWEMLSSDMDSTNMVKTFENYTKALINVTFATKIISVSSYDKPFITEELKKLRRQRQRLYRKEGRSINYLKLKDLFDHKLKHVTNEYMNKLGL